jgi:hypothetical protein
LLAVAADHLLELVVGALNGMDVEALLGALDRWAGGEPLGKPRIAGDDPVRRCQPHAAVGGRQQALDQDQIVGDPLVRAQPVGIRPWSHHTMAPVTCSAVRCCQALAKCRSRTHTIRSRSLRASGVPWAKEPSRMAPSNTLLAVMCSSSPARIVDWRSGLLAWPA